MIDQLASLGWGILFLGSFALAGFAVLEKLINIFGFTFTIFRGYAPSRLLEYAAILLIFVIALLLREIQRISRVGASD